MDRAQKQLTQNKSKEDIFGNQDHELGEEVNFVDFPTLLTLRDDTLVRAVPREAKLW